MYVHTYTHTIHTYIHVLGAVALQGKNLEKLVPDAVIFQKKCKSYGLGVLVLQDTSYGKVMFWEPLSCKRTLWKCYVLVLQTLLKLPSYKWDYGKVMFWEPWSCMKTIVGSGGCRISKKYYGQALFGELLCKQLENTTYLLPDQISTTPSHL